MKNKKQDVVQLFQSFQKNILHNKPSHHQMVAEVRMMRFKVRPVAGDVSSLNFKNEQFIEALWSLGKLDEFFHSVIKDLRKDDRQIFFKLFDGLYQEYQSRLNRVGIREGASLGDNKTFEVEIFRERTRRGN